MRLVLLLRIWTNKQWNPRSGSMRRDGFFVEVSELGMFKFSFFERKVVLNADKDPPPMGREKDLQNCRRM